jgi:hypothetical protein
MKIKKLIKLILAQTFEACVKRHICLSLTLILVAEFSLCFFKTREMTIDWIALPRLYRLTFGRPIILDSRNFNSKVGCYAVRHQSINGHFDIIKRDADFFNLLKRALKK